MLPWPDRLDHVIRQSVQTHQDFRQGNRFTQGDTHSIGRDLLKPHDLTWTFDHVFFVIPNFLSERWIFVKGSGAVVVAHMKTDQGTLSHLEPETCGDPSC